MEPVETLDQRFGNSRSRSCFWRSSIQVCVGPRVPSISLTSEPVLERSAQQSPSAFEEETAQVSVFRADSNFSNGNTRDREGRLITCEHRASG